MDKQKQSRPAGRPKADNPASVTLPRVRITPDKLEAYKQAAEASDSNFSQWVRTTLDKGVKKKNG